MFNIQTATNDLGFLCNAQSLGDNKKSYYFKNGFDLLVVDPENMGSNKYKNDSIQRITDICNSFSTPILVISRFSAGSWQVLGRLLAGSWHALGNAPGQC